jgi:hypothetical protein
MSKDHKAPGLLDPSILLPAMRDAFVKLDPRKLLRNPVIFVTEVVAAVVTILFIRDLASNQGEAGSPARSPPGSGSQSSSPPSPKPWLRVVAVPRPTA